MKLTNELRKQLGDLLLGKSDRVPVGASLRMRVTSIEYTPLNIHISPTIKIKLEILDDLGTIIGEREDMLHVGDSLTLADFKQFFEVTVK